MSEVIRKHPAKYSYPLINVFREMINETDLVLDPFAGTGRIHEVSQNCIGVEIEKEWAEMHNKTICGDSTTLSKMFPENNFDVICTSPTYGNRMADSHNAKDGSKRNTYTHTLGRELNRNNSGKMQWGNNYKSLHIKVYEECKKVLKDDGFFILNIKNHIRKGQEIDVFGWHLSILFELGFILIQLETLNLKGNGFGQNAKIRTGFEYVAKLKLQKKHASKRIVKEQGE